jgi:hypothetical protein
MCRVHKVCSIQIKKTSQSYRANMMYSLGFKRIQALILEKNFIKKSTLETSAMQTVFIIKTKF